CGEAEAVPGRLPVPEEADAVAGLSGVPPRSSSDRQRGDGSSVQDGVHPADEAVGDDLARGDRAMDLGPPGGGAQWSLERGISGVLAIEDIPPDGDSSMYSPGRSLNRRIIRGIGAIAPSEAVPPLSTEVSRSNLLTGPSRNPRQLRRVIWLSEGVPRSEPPIL